MTDTSCSRCDEGTVKVAHSTVTGGGASITYMECGDAACNLSYKTLSFEVRCYLCAQNVVKNTPVVSFKDDHGGWHTIHHDFQTCMPPDAVGFYPQVSEYNLRQSRSCALVGTQWSCQKSDSICKGQQICQAGDIGPVHVKCYQHILDSDVETFESWRRGFKEPNKRSGDHLIPAEIRSSKRVRRLDL